MLQKLDRVGYPDSHDVPVAFWKGEVTIPVDVTTREPDTGETSGDTFATLEHRDLQPGASVAPVNRP